MLVFFKSFGVVSKEDVQFMSHPEISKFHDVNRKKKLHNDFLIILKIFQHLFSLYGI
jgi:hypothetical protein